MVADSENYERDLLIRFREAYAEARKMPNKYKNVEKLLLGAIQVLEKEITEGEK